MNILRIWVRSACNWNFYYHIFSFDRKNHKNHILLFQKLAQMSVPKQKYYHSAAAPIKIEDTKSFSKFKIIPPYTDPTITSDESILFSSGLISCSYAFHTSSFVLPIPMPLLVFKVHGLCKLIEKTICSFSSFLIKPSSITFDL